MIKLSAWRCGFLALISLVLALAVSGCATTGAIDPLDAYIPPNIVIQPPDPQLPPHIAAMLGVWTGQMTSHNGFYIGRHAFVVQHISPTPRDFYYCTANICINGYGYIAHTFMSRQERRFKEAFWTDVVIEPDGLIRIKFRQGSVRYYLMQPGLKWMRAEWTWMADWYWNATLTRTKTNKGD